MISLHEMIDPSLADVFQRPEFRLTVDTHLAYFLNSGNYDLHIVDEHQALKYRSDLTGYLLSVNLDRSHHYAIMRMNRMSSVTDFNFEKHRSLLVPGARAFTEMIQRHLTSYAQSM